MEQYNFIDGYMDWVKNGKHGALTDACDAYTKATAYMVLAQMANRKFYIPFGVEKIYCNLWLILVGQSSFSRKSTSVKLGMRILKQVMKYVEFPDNFSIQKFLERLENQPQGICVVDEFIAFYKMMTRGYNMGATDLFTSLYDSGKEEYVKSLKSGTYIVKNPFINIFGGVVLEKLESNIKEDDLTGGFLYRFFFVVSPPRTKDLDIMGKSDKGKEKQLVSHLLEIQKQEPTELRLSSASEAKYRHFHKEVMEMYREQENLSPFVARLLTDVHKFAILEHLAVRENIGKKVIEETAMNKAVESTKQFIETTSLLFEDIATTPYQKRRRTVLNLLEKSGGETTESELLGILKWQDTMLNSTLRTLRKEQRITRADDRITLTREVE